MNRTIRLRAMNGAIKGRTWDAADLLRVGRLAPLEIVLDDNSVSRYHAEIRWTERGWRLQDLGSANGTRLNGVRLGQGQWPLRLRDLLQFGEVAFVVDTLQVEAVTDSEPNDELDTPAQAPGVADWVSPSPEIWCGMQNLLRGAAKALANLAEKVHQWADWADDLEARIDPVGAEEFAGVDIVGIDFSTSIQKVASHVIRGWDRYRAQVDALRPNHAIWVFGVNTLPFPLTRRPVLPRQLPNLREEHFQPRGCGRGLIEYGSAFYDYFLVALGHAQELGVFNEGHPAPMPITISLLCDGLPNGGAYRASDVRPLLEAGRAWGVRFKLVGFALRAYRDAMRQFRDSLGLTREELEIAWYEEGTPNEQTVGSSFDLLSRF